MKQVSSFSDKNKCKRERERERETHDVADDCNSNGDSHGRASGVVGLGQSGGRRTGEIAESGRVH
jgi:hypothetical protein